MAVALQDPTERGGLSADLSPVLADGLGRGYEPGLGRQVSEVPGAGQARQRLYSGVQVQDEGVPFVELLFGFGLWRSERDSHPTLGILWRGTSRCCDGMSRKLAQELSVSGSPFLCRSNSNLAPLPS